MTKKGYVLLETVITLVCLIILIIPILKSVDLIEKDRMQLKENREIWAQFIKDETEGF